MLPGVEPGDLGQHVALTAGRQAELAERREEMVMAPAAGARDRMEWGRTRRIARPCSSPACRLVGAAVLTALGLDATGVDRTRGDDDDGPCDVRYVRS
jgi:hypothetical protein